MVFFKDEEEFVDQKKLRQKTGSGKEIMARELESKKNQEIWTFLSYIIKNDFKFR